ncbi:MAG TPA: trehalase family glycosidase [Gammaproteobacteria bacterium]|nr:trehalase family glycosidase [Gammaproteobacteria bacterium]
MPKNLKNFWVSLFFLIGIFLPNAYSAVDAQQQEVKANSLLAQHTPVLNYIQKTWPTLTRSHAQLLQAAIDPKLIPSPQKWIVYIPTQESLSRISTELKTQMSSDDFQKIVLKKLPADINHVPPGLLYLPYPYVVPGGMFNEMYGWDSYFIILGLLKSQQITLAKNIVDNFIYEIIFYGKILNSNRTFHLERSQPPLLTEMILAVYDKTQDKNWLKSTLPAIEKFYTYWITPPHLISELGLSRYYAEGKGPAYEVTMPDKLTGKLFYNEVKNYYRQYPVSDYDVNLYYNKEKNQLTEFYYINDRTLRESGFDLTGQYGAFGAMITDYAPVTLNSLLYKMEVDTQKIYTLLGDLNQAQIWQQRAKKRAALMNRYLWDNMTGYYFDYNFKTKQTRPYIDASTFYPLWAGVASSEQAKRIVENLPALETHCGVVTSRYVTHMQWDAPYGWAPLQYFAVTGLANYGYDNDARRIAQKWNHLIDEDFAKHGKIVEKYDLYRCSSELTIRYGYSSNEAGFGWTNGVYLFFRDFLNPGRDQLQ